MEKYYIPRKGDLIELTHANKRGTASFHLEDLIQENDGTISTVTGEDAVYAIGDGAWSITYVWPLSQMPKENGLYSEIVILLKESQEESRTVFYMLTDGEWRTLMSGGQWRLMIESEVIGLSSKKLTHYIPVGSGK